MQLFFYNREQKVKKLDEAGKPIPVIRKVTEEVDGVETEIDEVVPNQFEMDTVIRRDSFNLESVVRTHMLEGDHIIVMLNDGHEESQVVERRLKNEKKPPTRDNVEDVKARVFIVSEISLKGEDAKRFLAKFDV